MKSKVILSIMISATLSACGGSSGGGGTVTPTPEPTPVVIPTVVQTVVPTPVVIPTVVPTPIPTPTAIPLLQVSGLLVDFYSNENIANGGVTLSINGVEVDRTTSNDAGHFELSFPAATTYNNLVVSSDKQGYAETSLRIESSEELTSNNLYLPPVHAQVSFDGTTEKDLQVDNKTIISLEKNSFVNASGEIVSTVVSSELFIIDPTLNIDLMPGDMVTVDPTNPDAEVPIESFGAITATFTDENGLPLQLAEGKTAEIRIPVSGNNPPTTIPLYYYDDIDGVWVKEGEATFVDDVDGDYYLGNVSHFTTWNADRIYETINIEGCVEDVSGNRISNARVNTEGSDYNGRTNSFSNAQGDFIVQAKTDSRVFVSASKEYQSRTVTVNTNDENVTLETCLVLDNATSKIELNWGESPDDLDSHFYGPDDESSRFHIYFSNKSEVINSENIYLDVDDLNSYGPEIITIPNFPLAGTYQYSVYKYTYSGEIKRDETRVELILNDERTLFVPPEGEAKRWWHVFEIVVSEAGEQTLNIINEWGDIAPVVTDAPQETRHRVTDNRLLKPQSIAEKMLSEKYYAK